MGRSIFPNPEVVFSNCNFPITISVARTLTGFSVRVPRMTSVTGDVPYISRGEEPSVAVIGAGAAGLAAGRLLRDEGLRVTIFEKSRHLGGVWRYDPSPEAKAPMCESKGPCRASLKNKATDFCHITSITSQVSGFCCGMARYVRF